MSQNKKRILWIDIAKAIGILTVVVGHSTSGPVRGVIYSFHMILFFLLSAWTTRYAANQSDVLKSVKKSTKHLLLPVLVVFLLRFVIDGAKLAASHSSGAEILTYIKDSFLKLLFASGNQVDFFGRQIPALGLTWFLIALFIARILFDELQLLIRNKWALGTVCFAISLIGVIIGKYVWLPLSLDIVLAIQIIFFTGWYLRDVYRVEDRALLKTGVSFIIWVAASVIPVLIFKNTAMHLNFAGRVYPLFPLCYVAGIAATLFIAGCCWFFSRIKAPKLIDMICYLGRNTLYFMLVHHMDKYWSFLFSFVPNMYVKSVLRIAVDLVVFVLFMSARWFVLKKVGERKNTYRE